MVNKTLDTPTRRNFLMRLGILGGALIAGMPSLTFGREDTDQDIFARTIRWGAGAGLAGKPVGEIIVALGEHFIGTPYLAHSLEEPGDEHLVINLRGFDCLTLVENCLALSRCLSSGKTTFEEFRAQLTRIRYAGGVIAGYTSRLHYFSDWMADNARKGIVQDITMDVGGEEYHKTINFMSTHRQSYTQLADDASMERVKSAETNLSGKALHRVPREKIGGMLGSLRNGDVIGTVTSMEGMDISHTGMVIVKDGTAKFLHAPLSGGAVTISEGSLAEYVRRIKSTTGIVVARPLAVAG
jgi:hypothetical protein